MSIHTDDMKSQYHVSAGTTCRQDIKHFNSVEVP